MNANRQNQNPFLSPNASGSNTKCAPLNGEIYGIVCAILAACLGIVSSSGWIAFWFERSIFSFMGVFTATAVIFAVVSGYLIIRRGGVWVPLAVYGAIAVLLMFVRSPNHVGAARLIAVQSLLQMAWTVLFTIVAKPLRDSQSTD